MDSKQINPIQDMFSDIKKILDFMEVKDNNEAMNNETEETRGVSELWIGAMLKNDTYLTYKMFWNIAMFQDVVPNVRFNNVKYWIEHPMNVPLTYRDHLLEKGRQLFLDSHIEKNEYYRKINGLPPLDAKKSDFIYLSEPLRNQLHANDIPVHELSPLLQNRYIQTEEYQAILKNNPDKVYLKYLGIYKIDILIARRARDFEIIRLVPMNRSDINPNLLKQFATLYNQYRDYVMWNLYNKHLESIYPNYRTFMGIIILSFVLMQISNKSMESLNSKEFLDDNIIHIMLSMYGIPDGLIMTKEVRRNLVINLLKLTRDKGTSDIYYDLIQILGYHDVVVNKLMLMKGQKFGSDGKALFSDGTPITPDNLDLLTTKDPDSNNPVKEMDIDPYFVSVDIKDTNPYDTITSNKVNRYGYKEITNPDPTWWDLPDTQNLLKYSNYTAVDSKYIMIEALIFQIRYLFESIYFSRLILDNKEYTDKFVIGIPEIFGMEKISIYDIMVFLVAATCMKNGLRGDIIHQNDGMLAIAGFNFDVDIDTLQEFLDTSQYLDREKIIGFLENLSMTSSSDIYRLFNDVISPMRDWLENKIAHSTHRYEFIEYENLYKALYTYDLHKNPFSEDHKLPMNIIKERYNLSDDDILAYQHFYPRTIQGKAITIQEFRDSRYNPFLDNNPIIWNIDIPFKGRLYFHDILNCSDLRTLKNDDGMYLFLDDFNEPDKEAIWDAINSIKMLPDDELNNAYFRINTPILNSNGKSFSAGTKLPSNIRSEIFKNILIDKIQMDTDGLVDPPETYLEYLSRKNKKLYELLTMNNRVEEDLDSWLNDVMKIVLSLETELDMHMKYFEQSIVGSELFFKPLITLINHFKSTFVSFSRTNLRYIFGDKMDIGGNSNMLKLFDDIELIIHFVMLAQRGYESQFGLYDTEHRLKYGIIIKDEALKIMDEMIFFKNGENIDPPNPKSSWYSGNIGSGRWANEDDFVMRDREGTVRINNAI